MMEPAAIFEYLDQAAALGVKEIYFTGGEPFLHRDFLSILERTLARFPASVLTNGLPINDRRADRLKQIASASRYSLEMRISLDSYDEEENDQVRGRGTYRRILAAYKRLYDRGFMPILTVTEIDEYFNPHQPDLDRYSKYVRLLRSIGVDRPRLKIIPIFEMGMLQQPRPANLITHEMMHQFDHSLLQCSSSRMVAENGVYACPILVGEEAARVSEGPLEEGLGPCDLYHTACTTCYLTGMTCKNY